MSTDASISSPIFEVDGVVSRSTTTSSAAPSPIARVSIWIPRAAARAASLWPEPVVSLPSDRSTIRFWASSGNSAEASRRAAPMSVAERTGVVAIRSISRTSWGRRSTRAARPKPTIPATSPSGIAFEAVAKPRRAHPRGPAVPTESDRSTTIDGREPVDRAGRAGSRPGRRRGRRGRGRGRAAPAAAGPVRPGAATRGAGRSSAPAPGSAAGVPGAYRSRCPSGRARRATPEPAVRGRATPGGRASRW